MFRLKILKLLRQSVQIPKINPQTLNSQIQCMSASSATQKLIPNIAPKSEQEFLVRLQNDPDLFGGPQVEEPFDEDDIIEEKYLEEQPLPTQKLRTKQYADLIKDHLRQHHIKAALDVLEVKMLKEDRVKPCSYIYTLLIGACGRVGYTKKAFALFNKMKQRGLNVHPGAYTGLFNACANSPWATTDGLTRTKHLHKTIIEKLYEPNEMNYNAMIKAYGRGGDISTAFQLVDEMCTKKLRIKADTINFLLQACISDKEAGFRHALLVWRTLIAKRIRPNNFSYNLLLRTIRDCGIGDVEVLNEALNKILKEETLKLGQNEIKLLSDGVTTQENSIEERVRPNLLARVPHLGSIITLSEIHKAEDRLLLVGGANGFLENMEQHKCIPDIKTFTQLLDCLPGSVAAEKDLLTSMKQQSVYPDVDFYNMLMKKRCMRFDYEGAKEVLKLMSKMRLKPDLITYGILAMGCKTKEEALEVIQEMKSHSYSLNPEILGAMLHQACFHVNFPYVIEIMNLALSEEIKPNKKFMKRLVEFKKKCKYTSQNKSEQSENINFQKGHRIFMMSYRNWLEKIEVDESEDAHPWTQYRQNSQTDSRRFKEKSVRFTPKRKSAFRVKTSLKHAQKKQ